MEGINRNAIIESIYKDKQYIGYCQRVCTKGDLYQDLFQYVILCLMEMNEDKLLRLHSDGGLRMYIVRIIYINAKSERSEFNKQYVDRVVYADMSDNESINENLILEVENEIEIEKQNCIENNVYPASAKLLEIYAECGSYQAVANKTKIPYKTCRRHIHALREKIIKNINDKNFINYAI